MLPFWGPHGFYFYFYQYILKTVKCADSENKLLATESFILSVQLTQSPVTNDPFGFFPATLCNCSSTNDRVTFVFLHEDRIRKFVIVVARRQENGVCVYIDSNTKEGNKAVVWT